MPPTAPLRLHARFLGSLAALALACSIGSHEARAAGKPPVDIADTAWLFAPGKLQVNIKKVGKHTEEEAQMLFHFDSLPPEAAPGTLPQFDMATLFDGGYTVKKSSVTLLPDADAFEAFIVSLLEEIQSQGNLPAQDSVVFESATVTKLSGRGSVKEKDGVRTMKLQLKASFTVDLTVSGQPAAAKGSFAFKSAQGMELPEDSQ